MMGKGSKKRNKDEDEVQNINILDKEEKIEEVDKVNFGGDLDPTTSVEEVVGRSLYCGKCRRKFESITEIRVIRGRVPAQFYEALYRVLCVECAGIVSQAIRLSGSKGEIVGYEKARNGTLVFFRNVVADGGGYDEGCLVCGKKDDPEKPDKFRHWVITGLPTNVWKGEPEMRKLVGRQLCELHARTSILAGFITVPIRIYLDRQAEKLQALADEFNSRRPNNG